LVHDPRHLKFFVVVYLYLMAGLITCNRVVGHSPFAGESGGLIILANALLIPLSVIGLIRSWRSGRFVSFDKWLWSACTLGCYTAGFFAAMAVPGR
jgi:hypothetical protein